MKKLSPDFLQIPYRLVCDKELTPMDKMVYGGVYFFSKMRGESCYASNRSLAILLSTTDNSVSRALKKLEEKRYIYRTYHDTETRVTRKEIVPLVAMGKTPFKKPKATTPNGVVHEEFDTTPNGIVTTPNGVVNYTKRCSTKMPKKGARKSSKSLSKGEKDQKGYYTKWNRDIDSIENTYKNSNIELSFPKEKTGKKVSKLGLKKDQSNGDKRLVKKPPLKSSSKKEKSTGAKLNDAIALFLEIFPGDFVGGTSAFEKPPTRKAVESLLKRYSHDEIKELIKKYHAGIADPYRPGVGTVYEFCTLKLAKVEAYVKKTGGLWAQRSISTPEHSQKFDSKISEILEKSRKEAKEAKEAWEDEKLNENKNGK